MMPQRKEKMCVYPAGFSLENGTSPGDDDEEEEAEELCEMRLWPHIGLAGDDCCFVAAQRERSQGFRI